MFLKLHKKFIAVTIMLFEKIDLSNTEIVQELVFQKTHLKVKPSQ